MQQESTSGAGSSPRERFREQTRAEIKSVALLQLAEGGVDAIVLTRIAREVGLSGPALYRYFASRDDLLTSLVRDAYDDVGQAIHAAAGSAAASSTRGAAGPSAEPAVALHALADAYLGWASDHPARYLLVQGTPVPGYTAPPDTLRLARAAMGPFLRVFAAGEPGESADAVRPTVAEMAAWANRDEAVANWLRADAGLEPGDDRAGVALAGTVLAWSQLHGTASLDVSGQYAGMGHRAETLVRNQMTLLAEAFRLGGA